MASKSVPDTAGEKYLIGAGRQANARLNLQYYLIQQQFNHDLLSPSIVNTLAQGLQTPHLRIADVCCGTGIWLINLSHHAHPSAELHGFDRDLTNLPLAPWVPRIIRHQYNIFEPPPEELQGTFDIVNVAFTLIFVTDATINEALSNVLSLLKPGGWLQWTEGDPYNSTTHVPDPSIQTKYMQHIVTDAWDLLNIKPSACFAELDSVFQDHPDIEKGSVSAVRPELDPSMIRAWTEQLGIMGAEEIFAGFWTRSPARHTEEGRRKAEEYRETVEGAYKEFTELGAGFWTQLIRVTGRKGGAEA